MEKIPSPENAIPSPESRVGEERTLPDGSKQRWVEICPVRDYFSHSGPGWDYKARLDNEEWCLAHIGQTFDWRQASDPASISPDILYYGWEAVNEDGTTHKTATHF
jgi:hypothetical protein